MIRKNTIKFSRGLNTVFLIILTLAVAWFTTIRPFGYDRDCLNYFIEYLNADSFNPGRLEIGYIWLMRSASFLGLSFSAFVFLVTSFALLAKVFFVRQVRISMPGLIFYLLVIFPLLDYTQIRASLALAIAYVAAWLIIEKKNYSYGALLFFLSITFHLSGLILLVAVLSTILPVRKFFISIIAIVFAVFFAENYIFNIGTIQSRILYYSITSGEQQKILTIQNILILGLLSFGFLQNKTLAAAGKMHWYLFCFAAFVLSITTAREMPVVSGRLLEASFFAYILWVPFLRRYIRYLANATLIVWGLFSIFRYTYSNGVFDGLQCPL